MNSLNFNRLQNPVKWGILYIVAFICYMLFGVLFNMGPANTTPGPGMLQSPTAGTVGILDIACGIIFFVAYLTFYTILSSNNRILLEGKTLWSPKLVLWVNIVGVIIGSFLILGAVLNIFLDVMINDRSLEYLNIIMFLRWPIFINVIICLLLFALSIGVLIDAKRTLSQAGDTYTKKVRILTIGNKWVWIFYTITCLLCIYFIGFDYENMIRELIRNDSNLYYYAVWALSFPYLVVSFLAAYYQNQYIQSIKETIPEIEDHPEEDKESGDDDNQPDKEVTPESQAID